ncbi:MAG: TldD/PmbA family protein [Butyrivibrio sp.]|nr:TldD/PmbA family protein [Butyrivibrio sp.]
MEILEKIESYIGEVEHVAAWELTCLTEKRWEFYFIRHQLDQNRAVEEHTVTVKLYRAFEEDGQKFLGAATAEIPVTAAEEEIRHTLTDLIYEAGLIRNPAYTLTSEPVADVSHRETPSVSQIAEDFLRTMQEIPETQTEDINSYELFVSEMTRSFCNSNGVAYTETWPSSMLEVVINARTSQPKKMEIELYRMYRSGTCDRKQIAGDISRVMRFGRDRLVAQPTPAGLSLPVIFSTDDAKELYAFFAGRMLADMKYQKISGYEIGEKITERKSGDPLTLEALAALPNSSDDCRVDLEGSLIWDRPLIEADVARNFYGKRQFSQYIGLEKSSYVFNFRVPGGSESAEALRSGDYLELVEFSDFQVDDMSGDIAGEIRLGYLHRDGDIQIVTGGSVSGSMLEAVSTMAFSRETVQYNRWVIPAVTKLTGLRITGVV